MDFYKIMERSTVRGRGDKKEIVSIDIYPDFLVMRSKDLMIRGKNVYAIWDQKRNIWTTDEYDVQRLVDEELYSYKNAIQKSTNIGDIPINVATMRSNKSKSWAEFKRYVSNLADNYHPLDEKLTFLNSEIKKTDYISKTLPYSLEEGDYSAWDELVGTLYDPSEREKIEWSIGSIVSGDSKTIQKFCVFYGEAGTGKSTIINIIQKLFDGYYVTFDAKSLGSSNNQFATEAFRSDPLVAIQHDGDLSRIEDNTRINSIVSHEMMTVKEKFKPEYMARANCFLFMGTNRPVKITDGRSGIIRRLIDITPSGRTIPTKKYDILTSQIDFQLGAIAYHCLDVYRELGKNYYKNYIPRDMIMKTDVFYNFIEAFIDVFESQDGISLKQAYSMYKEYCDDALVEFKLPRHKFREEMKPYFNKFEDIARIDGKQVRSWYSGFKKAKMEPPVLKRQEKSLPLVMDSEVSLLDDILADCPAQYGIDYGDGNEKPETNWDEVKTKLKDIDTKRVHYILPQFEKEYASKGYYLIMIDFDMKNEKGEKDAYLNAEAASKWPKTYAEYSKGGCGIHLIYWYKGDVTKLEHLYSPNIEIKTFIGKGPMRRRLSKCNTLPIATLEEGSLPLKEDKMLDIYELKDEIHLRNIISKCLRKQCRGNTTPEINLILKVTNDAYESGIHYDVSDMENDILNFAMLSNNQSEHCIKQVNRMKLMSKDVEDAEIQDAKQLISTNKDFDDSAIVFFDIEIYPPGIDSEGFENEGLFMICYKKIGEGNPVRTLINPTPSEVESFLEETKGELIGYNNLGYDNNMVYARYIGYNNTQLYELSYKMIVEHARDAGFIEAKRISKSDVLDFLSKKQSLKKWEIELAHKWDKEHPNEINNPFRHIEMGIRWDKPAPKSLWSKIAEYCSNDVITTEQVFLDRHEDWATRKMLAAISRGSTNSTTNQLSAKFVFEDNLNPQNEFNYRFMGDMSDVSDIFDDKIKELGCDPEYTKFDSKGRPLFPNYKFEFGKSTYRGEEVGEGGYVYANPGIYQNIPTQDVSGMHPSSYIKEELFGPRYTKRVAEIVKARVLIKHGKLDEASKLLDGKLAPYLKDPKQAKGLAAALKIVVNSIYGLTSAKFPNRFRDPRNVDNIVAKRGALFMVNLKHEVQRRGFTVAHIKTDSIKVPNATPEIIQFIRDYGALYGYSFETEAFYERFCLVNDAVYIAYEKEEGWTATGTQFQQPYIFKTLFSGEQVDFNDLCETKSVKDAAIYLDHNEDLPNVDIFEKELLRRKNNQIKPDKPMKLNPKLADLSNKDLEIEIAKGHDYHFVGRVGRFCPMKPGTGGGRLMVYRNGKYDAVSGSKGFLWQEAELVKSLHKEDCIDKRYYEDLADKAIAAINQFGEGAYARFVDLSKPYEYVSKQKVFEDEYSEVPCGDNKYNTCFDCPNRKDLTCKRGYSLENYMQDELPF